MWELSFKNCTLIEYKSLIKNIYIAIYINEKTRRKYINNTNVTGPFGLFLFGESTSEGKLGRSVYF